MTHLINRLQFQVQYSEEAQAFNLRQNFAVTFQEQIIEAVDVICSKYVSEEEWLRIDKLEINLGHFTPHAFDVNFPALFKNKFEKELKQKLSGISPAQKKASLQISKAELFQYFLRNGTLPSWADGAEVNLDEISVDILLHQPEGMSRFFYKNRFRANVWKRVAFQLNEEAKALIVSLIEELKNAKAVFKTLLQEVMLSIKEKTGRAPAGYDMPIDDIIIKNAHAIFQHPEDKAKLWSIAEENAENIFTKHAALALQIIQDQKALLANQENNESKYNSQGSKPQWETGIEAFPLGHVLDNEIIYSGSAEENSKEERYFVKHSGIVLLALFLKPFFINLGLLDNTEWKNKEAQHKAIHLLKYLSTGQQKIPEYNLTLEKIICGVAIDEPIPINVVLSDVEMKEAEMLLGSVIEHWKALKNTSVNGLREGFVKRDGSLKKQENGWLLQVERKTLDVLIDSIPWGYSTIIFPWNPYHLFVEW